MNHPVEKTFIYETPETSEADKCLMLKPYKTNGFGFVGASLVSCALMLAKKGDQI